MRAGHENRARLRSAYPRCSTDLMSGERADEAATGHSANRHRGVTTRGVVSILSREVIVEAQRLRSTQSLWPVVIVSALLLPGAAWSQERAEAETAITVGSRIRLLAPTVATERIQGIVIQMNPTVLLMSGKGRTPVSVPREAISQLEVNTGRHRQTLTGMWMGAGIGALLGPTHPCFPMVGCDRRNTGSLALFYGLSGAVDGAVIGALIKRDQWTTVPLDHVRVTPVATAAPGVGLSVSVSF